MSYRIRIFILEIAVLISIVVGINEYVLYSLKPNDFTNWKNDSLFYAIVTMLWAIILPQLYQLSNRLKSDSRLTLLLRTFVLSFFISVLHQILSNLIFYAILYVGGATAVNSELMSSFYELVMSGLFIRTVEAIIITLVLYVIATNEQRLRGFVASYWPQFYRQILDSGRSISMLHVKDKGITVNLNTNEVIWFESAGNYVEVNLSERKHLHRQTMGTLYERWKTRIYV